MQKYLSIPVKNEANQLVLVNEVAIVKKNIAKNLNLPICFNPLKNEINIK